ncbi:uncharacterized protein TRIADDRAFT_52650 [Trichoplax adhaerens]|uniref:Laminin G domain-containing protein n=1 Tax=Trichoplax adhaerens TaxID=10228 RepID=B3RJJ6_TRIAD|nr:predicted protein [Trichoplax adhaerens]EDV29110.1 predicted protein [Trichoplax adhaerens]|eukprot:XP_002108312.1 predicted protein [Trichoplax adhaerens]
MRKIDLFRTLLVYCSLVVINLKIISGTATCKEFSLINRGSFVSCTSWKMVHGSKLTMIFSTNTANGLILNGYSENYLGLLFFLTLRDGRPVINLIRGHPQRNSYNATISKCVSDTFNHILEIQIDHNIFTISIDDIQHSVQLDKPLPSTSVIAIHFGNVRLHSKREFRTAIGNSYRHFKMGSIIGCLMSINYTSSSSAIVPVILRMKDVTTSCKPFCGSFYRRYFCLSKKSHAFMNICTKRSSHEKIKNDQELLGYEFTKKEILRIRTKAIQFRSIAFQFKTTLQHTSLISIYSSGSNLNSIFQVHILNGRLALKMPNMKMLRIDHHGKMNDYQWHWVKILHHKNQTYLIIDSKWSVIEAASIFKGMLQEFQLGSTAITAFQGRIRNIVVNGRTLYPRNSVSDSRQKIFQFICWDKFDDIEAGGINHFMSHRSPIIPKCSASNYYIKAMSFPLRNGSTIPPSFPDFVKIKAPTRDKKEDIVQLGRQRKMEINETNDYNVTTFDPWIELDNNSTMIFHVTIALVSIGVAILIAIFVIPVILVIIYRNQGVYHTNRKTWLDDIEIKKPIYMKVAIGEEILV